MPIVLPLHVDVTVESEGSGERWICYVRDAANTDLALLIFPEPVLRLLAALRNKRQQDGGAGVMQWTLTLPAFKKLSRRLLMPGTILAGIWQKVVDLVDED